MHTLIPRLTAVSVMTLVWLTGATAAGQVGRLGPARDRQPVRRTGTGILRGRVIDGVSGRPLVHAQVRLSGSLVVPAFTTTDDSGAFAFTNLPGGRYNLYVFKSGYLHATFPEMTRTVRSSIGLTVADGQVMDRVTVPLYRGGAITGHVVDAWGDPIESVSVQAVRLPGARGPRNGGSGSSNDAGEFRVGRLEPGSYLIMATPSGPRGGGGDEDTEPTASVPTYYPGVLSPEQAQPIVIGRGQVQTDIDFQVLEQSVATITGTVLDPAGQPATNGNVSVQTWTNDSVSTRWATQIRPDGSFRLKLTPGEYRLIAMASPNDDGRRGVSAADRLDQPTGTLRLTLGGESISNVVIPTSGGSTISGRVTFEGDAPPPDPSKITIMVQPRRLYGTGGNMREAGGDDCRSSGSGQTVNPDLTFTLENVRGTCSLSVSLSAAGRWRAKSAMYRDADLLDRSVDLTINQHVRDVQLVISSRPTELTADVTDDQGGSTQEYVLIAFSADKALWSLQRYVGYAWVPPVPVVRASTLTSAPAPSSARRTATVSALPPGDYYAVAVDDAGYDEIRDPAFLEQLIPSATRVTLREGEPQTLQMRRIKRPVFNQ